MMASKEERLGRKFIKSLKELKGKNWYGETSKIAKIIELDVEGVESKLETEWRKEVKEKIEKIIEEEICKKEKNYKKMRY